ncbi:RN19B ligase, partial [Chunga burmeisteri]|nr:RN19B ligase [Chunga burmeisteri]
ECPLCLLPQPPEAFPTLASCDHRSCRACLEQYLRIAVSESRVQVACPHCPAALQPTDVHRLLTEPALRDKYEEFLLRRLLVADPGTRWCPAPDCSYAVIAYGCAECPRLTCGREGCGTEFCYHCRQPWHPDGPCVPAPPAPNLASPAAQLVHPEDSAHGEALAQGRSKQGRDLAQLSGTAEDIKVCPRCSAFIMKINDGSCNRMNCTVCGCLFCWLCLQEISDVHFLSPSGCTFWGKRPWSRTRKILWQLGMVLGAPMVISLIAGIAVPVITVGIPIYMGRKVLAGGPGSRRSSLSGCQQCLSVTSSVLLSLFVSPIITAVTVGVGVPLMLTYVYGVVVLSLCR